MTPLSFGYLRGLSLSAAMVLAGTISVSAQDVASVVAGLRADMNILDERTRSLRADMEQLKRDNAAFREAVQSQTQVQYVTLAQFNAALAELEKAVRKGDKEVLVQITAQMETLAKQTQSALDALAKTASTTTPTVTTNFSDDYPKEGGTVYSVQPGDTLSSIAAKFNAQVRDIQNANKIADPTKLQVGTTLYIPRR